MGTLNHGRNLVMLLLAAALAFSGCAKEEVAEVIPEASFTFDYPAMPIALDSAAVSSPAGVMFEFQGSPAMAQALSAQGYTLGQISRVEVDKARLYFSNPVNSYYNSVKSITVQLVVGDGQPVTVAQLNTVPIGAQSLILGLNGVDVLNVLRSNEARLVAKMEFDGPIPAVTGHSLVLGAKVVVAP